MRAVAHALAIAALLTALIAQAATQIPEVTPPQGFHKEDGVESELTAEDIARLEPYADNLPKDLRELLASARPLKGTEARDKLRAGVLDAISRCEQNEAEALMCYVLKRAIIVQDQLAQHGESLDSLKAQIRVYTLSIPMALDTYEDDMAMLKSLKQSRGQEVSGRMRKFGVAYADFLMKLDQSLLNAQAQYAVAIRALGLLQWDLYRNRKERESLAPWIKPIYDFLSKAPAPGSLDDAGCVTELVKVRAFYARVRKDLE